ANLKDADLVITTSVAPVKKVAGKAQIFPWHINVSNDHYGQLYALLRELWDKKVLEDARFIY
ncbi:MAG: transcriptional regulator, partial [Lactobacillaceae bacterium]